MRSRIFFATLLAVSLAACSDQVTEPVKFGPGTPPAPAAAPATGAVQVFHSGNATATLYRDERGTTTEVVQNGLRSTTTVSADGKSGMWTGVVNGETKTYIFDIPATGPSEKPAFFENGNTTRIINNPTLAGMMEYDEDESESGPLCCIGAKVWLSAAVAATATAEVAMTVACGMPEPAEPLVCAAAAAAYFSANLVSMSAATSLDNCQRHKKCGPYASTGGGAALRARDDEYQSPFIQ